MRDTMQHLSFLQWEEYIYGGEVQKRNHFPAQNGFDSRRILNTFFVLFFRLSQSTNLFILSHPYSFVHTQGPFCHFPLSSHLPQSSYFFTFFNPLATTLFTIWIILELYGFGSRPKICYLSLHILTNKSYPTNWMIIYA